MKKISFVLSAFLMLSACEKEEMVQAKAESDAPAAVEKKAPKTSKSSDAQTTKGSVAFSIDGEKKTFGYLPTKQNLAMSVGTLLLAKPDAAATEEFSINAMNFNATKADLPQTISLELGKMMKESASPAEVAKAPKAIVNYVSKDGVQYRAYADVTFESYAGGVVIGTVADIELPTIKPKDKEKPPVKLSGARFDVTL